MDLKTGSIRAILKQPLRDPFTGNFFPCGAIVNILEIEPAEGIHPVATAICQWGECKQRIPLELLEEL